MIEYYRARAGEYDEWFLRQGRYDRGPDANAAWFEEVARVQDVLDALHLDGDVLELAPGTGIWTERLIESASTLTVVDASEEMLALARARVAPRVVRALRADLFGWMPDRQYDAAVFCFWLSHVPGDRMSAFLRTVRDSLRPGGRIFFADSRREATSTATDHHLPDDKTDILTRRLNDGRVYRIVKRFLEPIELERAFRGAGMRVAVQTTPKYFIYGMGERTA